MIKKVQDKWSEKAIEFKDIISDERGSLDIFSTKLGLAVLAVLVIVALIAIVPGVATDFFNWFTNTMKSRFTF